MSAWNGGQRRSDPTVISNSAPRVGESSHSGLLSRLFRRRFRRGYSQARWLGLAIDFFFGIFANAVVVAGWWERARIGDVFGRIIGITRADFFSCRFHLCAMLARRVFDVFKPKSTLAGLVDKARPFQHQRDFTMLCSPLR